MENNIDVKIFGKNYKLKSNDNSENKVLLLSELLNEKMLHTARKHNTVNILDVSVITALNLLEENILLKNIFHREKKILNLK